MRGIAIILTMLIFSACQQKNMEQEIISTYAFRLKPGEDLKEGIEKIVKENSIRKSGSVLLVLFRCMGIGY